jgi:CubicO group peptidase (beta-lactamase class C family)
MTTRLPVATILCAGCLLDSPYKVRGTTVPEDLHDGWSVGTPESVGLDPVVLADIHEELLYDDAWFASLGLMVAKDDTLVFETYLRDPADRDAFHHVMSVTKSVTSLVVGVGRDEGWFPELSTTICSVFGSSCDGLEPAKLRITFADLLTMRSGIDVPEETYSMEMWVRQPDDPLRYILEHPMYAEPGEEFLYREADPQLVTFAMELLTGRSETDIANDALFTPLGITNWYWEHGPTGVTIGSYGLHLAPRDRAKIGRLVLHEGTWNDVPLVSSAWIGESTTVLVGDAYRGLDYGDYWWLEEGVIAAWGHGGQWVVVVPEEDLIVAHFARDDTDMPISDVPELPDFLDLIRPIWE